MIIKTALNAHAGNLHRHLTRTDDGNERIRVVEVRGCASEDLLQSLREMKATAAGSRCEKSLYHCSFAAPLADAERLQSDAVWLHCADRLEQEFGLENHARAVVHHFKDGRWHQHVVWNRIDPETGRAAHLSHERRRAIKVARELERDLQLTPVPSQRPEHRKEQRPPEQWEKESARRTNIDADKVRDQIADCWKRSQDAEQFAMNLFAKDLILARGERRPFVVVDTAGNFYALGARVLPGETAATVRERLGPAASYLPTLEAAKKQAEWNASSKRYKRGGKSGEGERSFGRFGESGTRPPRQRKDGTRSPATEATAKTTASTRAADRAKEQGPAHIADALMRSTTEAQQGERDRQQANKTEAQKLDEERQRQAEATAMRAWQQTALTKEEELKARIREAREREKDRQQALREQRRQQREQQLAQQQGRGRSRKRDKPEPD